MKTEEQIKEEIEGIVKDIKEAERMNETLRVAGLFRMATALQWVLEE